MDNAVTLVLGRLFFHLFVYNCAVGFLLQTGDQIFLFLLFRLGLLCASHHLLDLGSEKSLQIQLIRVTRCLHGLPLWLLPHRSGRGSGNFRFCRFRLPADRFNRRSGLRYPGRRRLRNLCRYGRLLRFRSGRRGLLRKSRRYGYSLPHHFLRHRCFRRHILRNCRRGCGFRCHRGRFLHRLRLRGHRLTNRLDRFHFCHRLRLRSHRLPNRLYRFLFLYRLRLCRHKLLNCLDRFLFLYRPRLCGHKLTNRLDRFLFLYRLRLCRHKLTN